MDVMNRLSYGEPMDIRSLGEDLARHGLARHEAAVAALAEEAIAVAPGSATALADPDLPEVMRLRAFSVVARALARRETDREERDGAPAPPRRHTGDLVATATGTVGG